MTCMPATKADVASVPAFATSADMLKLQTNVTHYVIPDISRTGSNKMTKTPRFLSLKSVGGLALVKNVLHVSQGPLALNTDIFLEL